MNNLRCSKSLKGSGFALQLATGRKAGRLARISRAKRRGFTELHTSFRYLNSNPVRSFASILALLLSNVSSRFWTGFGAACVGSLDSKAVLIFFLSLSLPLSFTKHLHQPRNYEKLVIRFRRCLRLDVVRKKTKRKETRGKIFHERKYFSSLMKNFNSFPGI